jgi:hypothetical protein
MLFTSKQTRGSIRSSTKFVEAGNPGGMTTTVLNADITYAPPGDFISGLAKAALPSIIRAANTPTLTSKWIEYFDVLALPTEPKTLFGSPTVGFTVDSGFRVTEKAQAEFNKLGFIQHGTTGKPNWRKVGPSTEDIARAITLGALTDSFLPADIMSFEAYTAYTAYTRVTETVIENLYRKKNFGKTVQIGTSEHTEDHVDLLVGFKPSRVSDSP